ncbi:ice-binding family protein [Thioalkalivibrio sp. ALMg13-2]|uniref:ice-binding family protein n=1 Tax=Thioalkalivibrio sp. ALMg13-2 TaxID=1158167 RepID=UPI00039DF6F0|nr:ice-binding family protein [Thioalkalivibrio sp. ALMg13-2]
MDTSKNGYARAALYLITSLFILLSGCSDSRDEVLGSDKAEPTPSEAPTVTAVAPLNDATGVAINLKVISAEFSEPVTLGSDASFTVNCEDQCVSPTGTVGMDSENRLATFSLPEELEPQTRYTVTISDVESIANGVEMSKPFVWSFTTGATADLTRPTVISTQPETTDPGPTPHVPANTAISAVFSEDMDPASINENSFTLTCDFACVSPTGSVSYSVGSRTAVFTPDEPLEVGTDYTATITSDATDLAGNELAGNQEPLPASSDYVWTFTTTVETIPENVEVLSTQPLDDADDVCPTATVNATFDVPSGQRMDPLSITSATFTVTGPAPDFTPVEATSVLLDESTGQTATFIPLDPLTEGVTYTATILGGPDGVKDLAIPANEMLEDYSWSFTVGPECLQPVDLQTVSPFGTFGGTAGMTNEGLLTVIRGDIGTIATATSSITGFYDDEDEYTTTPANQGYVDGTIFTCALSTTGPNSDTVDPEKCAIAEQARLDAETAYNELAGLPGGPDPAAGNLANLTLEPGVYTAGGGSFMIEGGDLTLDAQGDPNAVWVFQMATTLTVGGPGADFPQSVILVNGAQSKNVFWQVGSSAIINAAGGGTMEGTIIAQEGAAISTAGNVEIVTINGRVLSLGASVTMVNTVINTPAP